MQSLDQIAGSPKTQGQITYSQPHFVNQSQSTIPPSFQNSQPTQPPPPPVSPQVHQLKSVRKPITITRPSGDVLINSSSNNDVPPPSSHHSSLLQPVHKAPEDNVYRSRVTVDSPSQIAGLDTYPIAASSTTPSSSIPAMPHIAGVDKQASLATPSPISYPQYKPPVLPPKKITTAAYVNPATGVLTTDEIMVIDPPDASIVEPPPLAGTLLERPPILTGDEYRLNKVYIKLSLYPYIDLFKYFYVLIQLLKYSNIIGYI